MNLPFLINLSLIALAVCLISSLWYGYLVSKKNARLVQTLGEIKKDKSSAVSQQRFASVDSSLSVDPSQDTIDAINKAVEKKHKLTKEDFWQNRFFRAGYFRKAERDRFNLFRLICFVVCLTVFLSIGIILGPFFAISFGLFGVLLGWKLPFSVLDRIIARRDYEILYYLPLEVEQICIGVSSSLDIGPCVQGIVAMADERDCENPVTELFRYVQHYVRAGASLDEALQEVGRLSCHTELKHTFMALSQVSKHGGEITKQLQQLANSVAQQRETKIDAKIKRLELEATGPVGLVFLAFMGILLIGLGAQVMTIFQ